MPRMNHLEAAARRKINADGGWHAFSYEVVGEGFIIIGGVPVAFYVRGNRKGRPKKWKGPGTKVLLTKGDVDDEVKRYSETTGNCPECCGERQTTVAWSRDSGVRKAPCTACAATGNAQKA